jgi:hypothetical protein
MVSPEAGRFEVVLSDTVLFPEGERLALPHEMQIE